jgi:hypothetical protein
MPTDAELYTHLLQGYQEIAAGMAVVREAVEKAFGVTVPSSTTIKAQLEAVASAIYVVADRLPGRTSPIASIDGMPPGTTSWST